MEAEYVEPVVKIDTSPLVEAAHRKAETMRLNVVTGHVDLSMMKANGDYREGTLKPYTARCDASADFWEAMRLGNDLIADCAVLLAGKQRAWDAVSAASVLATKHPCPTI